jgi:membrane carboxypeptidase/penicillin-binding protein PbpC
MIVENKTGNVLVYCGSNDFNDAEHFGQVDGVKAIRSPGSTLKPFLYGLSFEKGISHKSEFIEKSIAQASRFTWEKAADQYIKFYQKHLES